MDIDTFDKYETKRTGLTCDEALEASVCGYRVRCRTIPENAYIHYPGSGGWRIQFTYDGQDRSSCDWSPAQHHWLEQWEIVPLPSEVKRDSWGKPIVPDRTWGEVFSDLRQTEHGSFVADRPRDKWGQP